MVFAPSTNKSTQALRGNYWAGVDMADRTNPAVGAAPIPKIDAEWRTPGAGVCSDVPKLFFGPGAAGSPLSSTLVRESWGTGGDWEHFGGRR